MKLVKLLMTLIILQLPTSIAFSQLLLHTREVKMFVRNGASYGSITFYTEPDGATVWNQDGYITTDPIFVSPRDLTIPLDASGNSTNSNYGWDTDKVGGPPHLGRGNYTISVDVGSATLSVDCFGTTQLFSDDREITYDAAKDSFYNESNTRITSIDLFDDPICLQPSPPVNFICTNANHNGENPDFEWYWPYDPNRSGIDPEWPYDIKYKIYRSENFGPFYCLVSNLMFEEPPIEYTDYGVSINTNGIRYVYYATAYTDQAPESDASNWT